jgi:hypothetical protein
MLGGKQVRLSMLRDRIIRYQKAATVAREKAMTVRDPEQWITIADAWDELARRVETERRFRADFFRSDNANRT